MNRSTRCTLGLFAREPIPGQVKTRLAATVGPDLSARLYAAFLAYLVARFANLGNERVLAIADESGAENGYFQALSAGRYVVTGQGRGGLGERMTEYFARAFDRGAGRVVLIGTDCPQLPRATVAAAFERLAHCDVVLGPSADGGYYLVGQSRPLPEMFQGVAWSTASVLTATTAQLRQVGATTEVLPVHIDVDDEHDLVVVAGLAALAKFAEHPEGSPGESFAAGEWGPATREALEDWRRTTLGPSSQAGGQIAS